MRTELQNVGAGNFGEVVAPLEGSVTVLDAVARVVTGEARDIHCRPDVGTVGGEDLGEGQAQCGAGDN